MCTVEAPIHENIKQAIVEAQETDTELVLRRWKNTSRLFKNKVTEDAVKIERESTTGKFEEIAPYVSGKRGREVFINGDKDFGVSVVLVVLRLSLRSRLLLEQDSSCQKTYQLPRHGTNFFCRSGLPVKSLA
jgi:NAD(P)H-dependent flavin oxidoreductase YrpB (nitropropane dioxygenase family)